MEIGAIPGAGGGGGSVTPGSGSSGFTAGSVPFANALGALDQDNTNLSYSSANLMLKIGDAATTSKGVFLGYSGTSGTSGMWGTDQTPTATNVLVGFTSANTIINAVTSILFRIGNANQWSISGTVFGPGTNNTESFGSASARPTAIYALGLTTGVSRKTTTYLAVIADHTIFCDTTAGAFTVTLEASPSDGKRIEIKKVSTDVNILTIARNGNNIEGAAADLTTALTTRPSFTLVYELSTTTWWIV